MADVETPAAESSPAAEPTPASEPISIPTNAKDYAEWRQSGKLPGDDRPSKGEDSAPSKSDDEKSSEKGAPVSETGKKGRENAESRIKQLVAERDSFKARAEALEAGKKDASGDSSPAPAKNGQAASSPAPETELKRPVKPKQEDYDDWEAYDKAQDQYLEDLADYKAAQRLEEHSLRQQRQAATQAMQQRLDSARERYGDEAEKTITKTAESIFDDQKVPQALKAGIGRSEVLVDALYVMGSDAEEMSDFLKLAKADPIEALRKWFTIEALVKEELKIAKPNGAPVRGPDGKFLPERPAKREAPSPPRELGANSAPAGDERDRAAKVGDFRSFKADADRRDMRAKGISADK